VVFLPEPTGVDTTVIITSSNPAVAQIASGTVIVPAGSRIVPLEIITGPAGSATFTLESAGVKREFVVRVGTASAPAQTPVATASAIGVSVIPSPTGGRVVVRPGAPVSATLGVTLLGAARATPLTVMVTSGNPSIVAFGASSSITQTIEAGDRVIPIAMTTTGTEGAAVLTFEFDGVRQELLIVVGNPPASQVPAVVAPVIGVQVP
jgi:hypothetical protein